jgi:hypothetical protein
LFSNKSKYLKNLDLTERACFKEYKKVFTTSFQISATNFFKDSPNKANTLLNNFLAQHAFALRQPKSLADLYHYGYKRKLKNDKRFNGLMVEEYMAIIEKGAIQECEYIYNDYFSAEQALAAIYDDAAKFVDKKWLEVKPKNAQEASEIMRMSDGKNGYLWRYSLMTPLTLKINDKFKK